MEGNAAKPEDTPLDIWVTHEDQTPLKSAENTALMCKSNLIPIYAKGAAMSWLEDADGAVEEESNVS